jgi:hypothetical protein
MIIPNDLGGDWRIDKFVDYQHAVPPIYQATLSQYVLNNNLTDRDCVILAWFMSVTYSEITTIWLHKVLKQEQFADTTEWFEANKTKMIFGSAKKYNRCGNQFNELMASFHNLYGAEPEVKLYEIIGTGTEKELYDRAMEFNLKIGHCGRFSAELFNECCLFLSEIGVLKAKMASPNGIDWDKGANLTSCMFNLVHRDDLADEFDKTGKLSEEMKTYIPLFDTELLRIRDKIWNKYPERKVDVPLFTPKMCSFRNLFKHSRYGGYHHDRQLEHIKQFEAIWPEMNSLWQEIYEIRKQCFSPVLLGEINGWSGIRKERKRIWVDKGMTGIEPESIEPLSDLNSFLG